VAILGADRRHVAIREFAGFLPWCALGIGVGLYFFKALDAAALARALGVLILLYALYSLWMTTRRATRDPLSHPIMRPIAAALSGAVGTMFGAMATIFFAVYLNAYAIEKQAFRATMSAMLLTLSVIRAVAYAAVGEMTGESALVFLAALPAMAIGIYAGSRIHAKLNEAAFRRLVCAILALCAIPLLLK
jgi:uncharacterized membrane protein YfcA